MDMTGATKKHPVKTELTRGADAGRTKPVDSRLAIARPFNLPVIFYRPDRSISFMDCALAVWLGFAQAQSLSGLARLLSYPETSASAAHHPTSA
jgi:hypothetical protein